MHKVQRSLLFPLPLREPFFHDDPYDDCGHHGYAEAEGVHVSSAEETDNEERRNICRKGRKQGDDCFHEPILNHNGGPCIYAKTPSCFALSLFGK